MWHKNSHNKRQHIYKTPAENIVKIYNSIEQVPNDIALNDYNTRGHDVPLNT